MRRLWQMTFVLVLLAAPVAAQDLPPGGGVHVGFGASVSNNAAVLVPIDVLTHWRLEAEAAYARNASHRERPAPPLDARVLPLPDTDLTTSQRSTNVGVGVYYLSTRDRVKLSTGARIGYARTSIEIDTGLRNTTRLDGWFVGPSLGAEYFLGDRFSLGATVQVQYLSLSGDEERAVTVTTVTPGTVPPLTISVQSTRSAASQSSVTTRASVVARIYFK